MSGDSINQGSESVNGVAGNVPLPLATSKVSFYTRNLGSEHASMTWQNSYDDVRGNTCAPYRLRRHGSRRRRALRQPPARGLHLSNSRLNVSAFCGIGDALRHWLSGCFAGVQVVSGGVEGCISCQKRLRLKSGRV